MNKKLINKKWFSLGILGFSIPAMVISCGENKPTKVEEKNQEEDKKETGNNVTKSLPNEKTNPKGSSNKVLNPGNKKLISNPDDKRVDSSEKENKPKTISKSKNHLVEIELDEKEIDFSVPAKPESFTPKGKEQEHKVIVEDQDFEEKKTQSKASENHNVIIEAENSEENKTFNQTDVKVEDPEFKNEFNSFTAIPEIQYLPSPNHNVKIETEEEPDFSQENKVEIETEDEVENSKPSHEVIVENQPSSESKVLDVKSEEIITNDFQPEVEIEIEE